MLAARKTELSSVRQAVPVDLPRLIEMGRNFFLASKYSDVTTFSETWFAASMKKVMEEGVLVVATKGREVVGMAAALVYPFYFSGEMTAQEMFWWVEPEHRGVGMELLEALIDGVKDRGAKSLSMIALDALDVEKVSGIYEKEGFRPSERSFIKRIA